MKSILRFSLILYFQKLQRELSNMKRDKKKIEDEYNNLKQEHDDKNNNLTSKESVSVFQSHFYLNNQVG